MHPKASLEDWWHPTFHWARHSRELTFWHYSSLHIHHWTEFGYYRPQCRVSKKEQICGFWAWDKWLCGLRVGPVQSGLGWHCPQSSVLPSYRTASSGEIWWAFFPCICVGTVHCSYPFGCLVSSCSSLYLHASDTGQCSNEPQHCAMACPVKSVSMWLKSCSLHKWHH